MLNQLKVQTKKFAWSLHNENCCILVSKASGSNLRSLIDANLSGQIIGVLSNKADAYTYEAMLEANVTTTVLHIKIIRISDDATPFSNCLLGNWLSYPLQFYEKHFNAKLCQSMAGKVFNIYCSCCLFIEGNTQHPTCIKYWRSLAWLYRSFCHWNWCRTSTQLNHLTSEFAW